MYKLPCNDRTIFTAILRKTKIKNEKVRQMTKNVNLKTAGKSFYLKYVGNSVASYIVIPAL